ncbi:putative TIR domain, P-loop containing nucleoside triphosphate hydrolase [Helianthus anomalus]
MPIPYKKMVSPSHLVLVFCIYKLVKFTLPKIWRPPPKKNVQPPSLNDEDAPAPFESRKYDVFLSFRGEDVRKTFVDHLYAALVRSQIHTYKDDETLPRGDSIGPSLFEAIKKSRIAVIIFSKNYAASSWCLKELAYIMECKDKRGLIVMPIFYDVDPSEVRKQKGDFGKAFAKQEVEHTTMADSWRKALASASDIAGWEPKNVANGYEAKVIKEIIDIISDRLFSLNSGIDEDLVGMTTRLQELESQLEIGSGGVRMVGIWGVGGGGKTTLAFALYKEIFRHFQGHCIVDSIRVEANQHGLKTLQQKMLSSLLERQVIVQSVEEGKDKIKRLCESNVLIVLDDVNDSDQLESLVGSPNWFGSGSRIIITTRNKELLKGHKVNTIYPIKLLTNDEAIRLFNKRAYNEEVPVEDYAALSLRVISLVGGHPLAIKVLGRYLYDKDTAGWINTLNKLKDIPNSKVMDVLKISYDGLEPYEKEIFLDIACFFRRRNANDATEIFEACKFHPGVGIQVLIQKALITIVDGSFDMHDLVQEMGHFIVRGEHPNNPEKHSRVWKHEEIRNMCFGDATVENNNIEAIRFDGYSYEHDNSSRFCKIVSNMKNLRWLRVDMRDGMYGGPNFLSNELHYIYWSKYPASLFPDGFQPVKLRVLKLSGSMQKELWKGCKNLPQLKVLELDDMKKLVSTPDFKGLLCLQKLTLSRCEELEEIHESLGGHKSLEYLRVWKCPKLRKFPTMVKIENLKTLEIEDCGLEDVDIPSGIDKLFNLKELNLSWNDFSRLDFSLSQLTQLKILNLSYCGKLLELPELSSSLAILKAEECHSLRSVGDCHKNSKWLCQVSLTRGSIINDGGRLLQSMLQGNAIKNRSMLLQLHGLEVAKGFIPRLHHGSRLTLQLPGNWCNDFCGFLMCVVLPDYFYRRESLRVSIKHVTNGTDSQRSVGVGWEKSDRDSSTLVWYVPFGSLSHTDWWDQTYNEVSFDLEDQHKKCSGFGVRLVDKKSESGLTETPTKEDYTLSFKIEHDSASYLTISLSSYE